MEQVLAQVAAIFPGPYLHIGADEPRGMPDEAYASYVRRLRISGFDDLSFLLLPRLAGVAHRAWGGPDPAGWPAYRDRLARHGRLWAQDGFTYFRAAVDWV
jgi:N-acetyl-beta-hexosaminidase